LSKISSLVDKAGLARMIFLALQLKALTKYWYIDKQNLFLLIEEPVLALFLSLLIGANRYG
jgi:hypothetical protein